MEKLTFVVDTGESVDFFVLEETKIQGVSYLLVSESAEDEGECYILKDTSDATSAEATYEFVEDEEELEGLSKVFEELIEDLDVEIVK